MKISGISLKNFAAYDNVSVSFDNNITYLIGKSGSGKSTIGINAVHFILQGIAEKSSGGNIPLIGERFRFIGDKGKSATGELILHDEEKGIDVKVIRKLTKSGSELSFEAPEGMELGQDWLNDLFNIFMIAPKKFTELSGKEQAIALGIDTTSIDSEMSTLKIELTGLNRDLKQYDNMVEVEKVEKVDVAALQQEKDELKALLNKQYLANKSTNESVKKQWEKSKAIIDDECDSFNKNQTVLKIKVLRVKDLLNDLKEQGYVGNEVSEWIVSLGTIEELKTAADLYPKEPTDLSKMPDGYKPLNDELFYLIELPDDSALKEIDQKLLDAAQTNEKALLYCQYVERKEAKELKIQEIKDNKDKQAAKEQERLDKIKSYKFPFDNLSVNEFGELLLNDRPIKSPYFSTGQLLKIVPKLMATTNPELKYIFLQDFNLMDEDLQKEVESDLTSQGFQLVIEYVGKTKLIDKNCILLKDGNIVEPRVSN